MRDLSSGDPMCIWPDVRIQELSSFFLWLWLGGGGGGGDWGAKIGVFFVTQHAESSMQNLCSSYSKHRLSTDTNQGLVLLNGVAKLLIDALVPFHPNINYAAPQLVWCVRATAQKETTVMSELPKGCRDQLHKSGRYSGHCTTLDTTVSQSL